MITIKNENIRPFDIDGTLVLPYNPWIVNQPGRDVLVYDSVEDKHIKMIAHEPMIRLLKEEKAKGSFILVWSRSGNDWARNVIKALQLTEYVDVVMSKPLVYFDDVDVKDWMKDRVYLSPDMRYKK